MDSLVYFITSGDDRALFLKTIHFAPGTDGKPNSFADNLAHFLEKEELMGYLFRRIRVALPQALAALVPNRLFQAEELPTYLSALTDLAEGEVTQADELSFGDIKVVYQQNVAVADLLRKKFPTARLYGMATPFIEAAARLKTETRENYVVLNIYEGRLQLVHFNEGKALFYNSFPFHSASDVMYYTLLVYEQFQLDPAKVPLLLSGELMESSDIYKMLFRYVADIHFTDLPDFISWNKRFNDLPSHQFFTLFGLSRCK
jgi:hypothetical protein